MRILEIQGQVEGGGSERHTFILARALRDLGHDVVICVPDVDHEMIDQLVDDDFSIERLRVIPTWRRIFDLSGGIAIKKIIDRYDIDLVHTHLFNADVVGLIGARLSGRPVVTTLHGATLNPHLKRTLQVRAFMLAMYGIFRAMDHRIAISPFVRRYVAEDARIDPDSIEVIYNSSDVSAYGQAFDQTAVRRSLAVPQEAVLITCLGVLNPQKRTDLFVEAASRIARIRPNCFFLVVGQGPLRRELEAGVAEAGLSEQIRFLGYRSDVPELLSATDILVFPARDEGFGRAMTEAMSSSVPVVAFDSGACADVVEDEVTGFVVPDEDLDALVGRCIELIDDPTKRKEMGKAGLARARRLFDVPAFAARTETALLGVLRDHESRHGRRASGKMS